MNKQTTKYTYPECRECGGGGLREVWAEETEATTGYWEYEPCKSCKGTGKQEDTDESTCSKCGQWKGGNYGMNSKGEQTYHKCLGKQEQTMEHDEEKIEDLYYPYQVGMKDFQYSIKGLMRDYAEHMVQQARQEAFIAGRTVENYKGEWQEVYNDSHTSAKYETFEDYIKAINQEEL